MTITAEARQALITEHRTHEGDTGSPEVQVSILTERIQNLTGHLKTHRHDYASRRGLVMLVGKRNRLLRYLQRIAPDRYKSIIKKLGLRK